MSDRIKILVIEDEPMIAEDIRDYLSNFSYSVVGIEHTMSDGIRAIQDLEPDMVLIDINLEGNFEGIEIAHWLNHNHPLPFLYLTSYATNTVIEKAKTTRPMGYILKPFTEHDLYSNIEIAIHNYRHNQRPKVLSKVQINKKIPNKLTESEFKILKGIYEGLSNKQLAEKLFVSHNTVKTHLRRIYEKLDTHTRTTTIRKIRSLIN